MKKLLSILLLCSAPLASSLAEPGKPGAQATDRARIFAEQNDALNALKQQVKVKEAALTESEDTLQSQSNLLNCLSNLLSAYTQCESQFTNNPNEQRHCMANARTQNRQCAVDQAS